MSVLLPTARLPQTATIKLLDFGLDIEPPGGGAAQRLNRVGNRYAIDIVYPRLKPEPDGRTLMSAIRQAKTQGAIFPVPQPGLTIGTPGSPIVDGAGQTGSSLKLRGFASTYKMLQGQFLSLIINGQRYLYEAAADTTASGGKMTLPVVTMIRVSPPDATVAEVAKPYIEGLMVGTEATVELAIAKATPATITIRERE